MNDDRANGDGADTSEMERTLEAMQFVTPSFADSRARPVVASAGFARVTRPILLAAAVLLITAGLAFAASRIFPTIMGTPGVADCEAWECGDDFQVTAQMEDTPRSVRGFNVVVADGTGQERFGEIARALADRTPGQRVIVWFFSEASGQERHQLPLLPSAEQTEVQAPPPASTASWQATYDFPASGADPAIQDGRAPAV
jgi:hypothetical protein